MLVRHRLFTYTFICCCVTLFGYSLATTRVPHAPAPPLTAQQAMADTAPVVPPNATAHQLFLPLVQNALTSLPNLTFRGSIGGAVNTVAISGTVALVGDGAGLIVADVRVPAQPTQRARLALQAVVQQIRIQGVLAYLVLYENYTPSSNNLSEGILQIVDLTEPFQPQLRGSYTVPGPATGVFVQGQHAFFVGGLDGIQVLDVADPDHPRLLTTISLDQEVTQVEVLGQHLFATGWPGLVIAELPATLHVGGETPVVARGRYSGGCIVVQGKCAPVSGQQLKIIGDVAYLAYSGHGLHIIDIHDLDHPMLLSKVDRPTAYSYARDVQVIDGRAYVAYANYGNAEQANGEVQIIDVHAPHTPRLVGVQRVPGSAVAMEVRGDQGYVAVGSPRFVGHEQNGLLTLDLSQPHHPSVQGQLVTVGLAYGFEVMGNIVYMRDWDTGVRLIDVSNPTRPVLRGHYPQVAYHLQVQGNIAYLAAGKAGLQLVDVSDPSQPVLRGQLATPGQAQYVQIVQDVAYVVDDSGALLTIDVRDPQRPIHLDTLAAPGVTRVLVHENHAYLSLNQGLLIVDVQQPHQLTPLGTYRTKEAVQEVRVVNQIAYVNEGYGGLAILDITQPQQPKVLGKFLGDIADFQVQDDIVFCTEQYGGLRVVDVHDPTQPVELTSYDRDLSSVESFHVAGDLVFLADQLFGLKLLRVHGSATPTLLASFDSPGTEWWLRVKDEHIYIADEEGGLQILHVAE